MEEKLEGENRLIDLIKDQLEDGAKKLIKFLDLENNDNNKIIQDLIEENILNFGDIENDDKENR